MSDWEWWFTSEWGRDRILREEVQSLQASAASTAAHSARMRSQLARLEGSLETRLSALSAAFDAYVELGDVREQLTGYADTGAVRRRVRDAFKTMTEGGHPEPVVDDETDYWLAPATNSVIAVLAGGADPDADALASSRQAESRLFVVAAAGGLDHGAPVADRVPALFEGLTELDVAHRALFTAVVLGLYPGALSGLEPTFSAALAGSDPAATRAWVEQQAGSPDPQTQLEWIERLLDGGSVNPGPSSPAASTRVTDSTKADSSQADSAQADFRAPRAVAADRLRAVVVEMIEAGTGTEAGLLRRARVLRARIETPGNSTGRLSDGSSGAADEEDAPAPVPAADAVREELVDPAIDPATRGELLAWVRPSLLGAVDDLGTAVTRSEPVRTVQTPGGAIDVRPSGPDSRRQAQVLANLSAEDPTTRRWLIGGGVATGALAVLALVVAVANQIGLAVLLLIAAVVAAVLTGRQILARSRRLKEQADDVARAQQAIGDAMRSLQAQQQAERDTDAALQQTYQRVRAQLAG